VTMSGVVGDGTVTRAELAAQRIAERARTAAPGARLGTKSELRQLCGVSVGTFNEALRLLQSRGVVAVRPGPRGGLFVAEQSPIVRLGNSVLALDADAASVADAVRIRDALDPLVTIDAVDHSSPAAVARYREQVAAMRAATETLDAVGFLRANWRLHALIAEVNPQMLYPLSYGRRIGVLILRDRTSLG
jgi:DNA-binding FadR family transcriptional regulator